MGFKFLDQNFLPSFFNGVIESKPKFLSQVKCALMKKNLAVIISELPALEPILASVPRGSYLPAGSIKSFKVPPGCFHTVV